MLMVLGLILSFFSANAIQFLEKISPTPSSVEFLDYFQPSCWGLMSLPAQHYKPQPRLC